MQERTLAYWLMAGSRWAGPRRRTKADGAENTGKPSGRLWWALDATREERSTGSMALEGTQIMRYDDLLSLTPAIRLVTQNQP